jgi:DNA-binding IclR family transcriptional regulator
VTSAEASPSGTSSSTHRTIDRVTEILEAVVYQPGITFAELSRVVDAPKSSVHGFIRGLLAKGWLFQDERRFYLGPAVYGLTLASGHIRAGQVTQADLDALHEDTGLTVFLGVEAGDHLIYIGESGTDALTGFGARSNIRRDLISTAGGKVLLVERPGSERESYLRRQSAVDESQVSAFLSEFSDIKASRVAVNLRYQGAQMALAAAVKNQAGEAVAAAVLIGPTENIQKREARLRKILLKHVDSWSLRKLNPREAI